MCNELLLLLLQQQPQQRTQYCSSSSSPTKHLVLGITATTTEMIPTTTTTSSSSSSSKLLQFLKSELLPPPSQTPNPQDTQVPDDEDTAAYYRRREKVYTFVNIPIRLEKLMGYGFFQCADAFLYVFTFLPLRCAMSSYAYVCSYVCSSPVYLKPSDKCELLKLLILVISTVLFTYIDTNVLYHIIKSQSVIKLYIFFNMLEVGDRLFSSFSQDSLDALFITATEQHTTTSSPSKTNTSTTPSPPPSPFGDNTTTTTTKRTKSMKKLSTSTHALICGVSILGHALVILLQSTTLSVAINANNRALLTVMMSNNFVELKGSVFKKFDKMNLFQVSCSDIRERFHLCVLLLIVCLQTLREYSWEESRFWVLLPDCLMVLIAEIGVDWIKHAFITRFNELPLQVYEHYTRSLAYDVAESLKRKSNKVGFGSDYSDIVGRRLGFVPLPLAIVLIRVVTPMWRVNDHFLGILILSILGYVGLATFRVLNMIMLVGKAVRIIDEHHSCNVTESVEPPPERRGSVGASFIGSSSNNTNVKNSILKRSRTISGSDGDLLKLVQQNEKVDKKLTFWDGDNNKTEDDLLLTGEVEGGKEGLGKIHLFANSNVSLNSVGFNEEMMKVEAKLEEEVIGKMVATSERKHSLGSNLYEGVMLGGGGGGCKKEDPAASGDCSFINENDYADDDPLNDTVIEHDDDKHNIQIKQERCTPPPPSPPTHSTTIVDDSNVFAEQCLHQPTVNETATIPNSIDGEPVEARLPEEETTIAQEDESTTNTTTTTATSQQPRPSSSTSNSSSSGKKKLMNWFK